MTPNEKCELLKDTIYQLYSKEGRSRVYISKLLKVNRSVLGKKIKEWNFPEPEPKRHASARIVKFVNRHKAHIIKELNEDVSVSDIAKEFGISRKFIDDTLRNADKDIADALDRKNQRMHNQHAQHVQTMTAKSSRKYDYEIIENEHWKSIVGYSGYEVSDYGRIRKLAKRYQRYYLLIPEYNSVTHREYVTMTSDSGKRRNLMLARLVGFAFVDGYAKERHTINHKDGNIRNNKASNLEWLTQGENNQHSYDVLSRKIGDHRKWFKQIIYKNKYQFDTIEAFARFINRSSTQARRWLDEPEKHNIVLIK